MEKNEQQMPAVVDILPANLEAEIEKAKTMRNALDKLFKELMVPGTDIARIPGTDKPTLLKPGGELLCQTFHLAPGKAEILSEVEDFEKGVFSYKIGMPIYHRDSGVIMAYGVGAANSKEPKYRYRKQYDDDKETRIENPDPSGEQNTLFKMASKRAFIDGVLKATGASRMFEADDLLPPEKASTKQKNYIRMLLRGKDAAAAFQEILGLKLELDDLTRGQATAVIEELKKQPEADPQEGNKKKPASSSSSRVKSAKDFMAAAKKLGFREEDVKDYMAHWFNVDDISKMSPQMLEQFLAKLEALVGNTTAQQGQIV